MPEEPLKQENENKTPDQAQQENKEPEKIYTIEEDLEEIKKLDLGREICLKLQLKKHPNKKIDDLINRRIELNPEQLTGNIVLRIFISVFSVFFLGIALWGISYILLASINANWLFSYVSSALGFLTLSGMAISIFLPFPVVDENKINSFAKQEIKKLEEQAGTIEK